MSTGYNRYNHTNKGLTPRQKQKIYRKIYLLISAFVCAVILSIFVGGMFNQSKAADNYHKYYTSIAIMPGDTIYEYYEIYGDHYKNSSDYIEEVCMINSIDKNDIKAGNYIIIPYYSLEVK